MQTTTYSRKPLVVEAVQVTDDNIFEVAKWCKGDVYEAVNRKLTIQVKVLHPVHSNQTKAQAGDWILKSPQGFKIYADSAFKKGFEKMDDDLAEDLRRTRKAEVKEHEEFVHVHEELSPVAVEAVPATEALSFTAPRSMDTI